jgi:NitT/TauT family transport system ATP-binding protein
MLELRNVSLTYTNNKTSFQALSGINLKLQKGTRYAIIGPSGSGKTSLLLIMAGLLRPTGGEVDFLGERLYRPHQKMALILQEYGLLPWKTVWENAALGLQIRGATKEAISAGLQPILHELGLGDMIGRYPSQISGGQKQRVALTRALALNPELLLMDEPLSALDALTRENLQKLILKIWFQRRITVVLVTHSIEEAVYLGQEIIILQTPGLIKAVVANPLVGAEDFRNDLSFHQKCTEIRSILECQDRAVFNSTYIPNMSVQNSPG